ncbi:hypothetical protein BD779DRAFT_1650505 [Infundibulicybe gibba]|nr:hypothetical protein BD779DRAFT_1650505 [Infundibulicybe gibba]
MYSRPINPTSLVGPQTSDKDFALLHRLCVRSCPIYHTHRLQQPSSALALEMPVNAQPEPPSNTSRSSSQDTGGIPPTTSLQDSGFQALLQDSRFRSIVDRLGSAPSEPERFQPEYLPSEKVENADPPVGYVVDQRSLSRISIPPKPDGATLAEYPDGWSECLITNEIKDKIFSIPGFPAPLVHPPKAHRIGPAPGKGLGIFATRDLDMSDLIYVERPLLVLPSYVNHVKIGCPLDWTVEQIKRALMFEWGKECHRAFERLEPEAQRAYLSLANIHTEDGSGTVLGICRTNGFGIEGLADIVGTYEAPYTGICKEFSRANHSCTPNITRYFDHKAFAFCFAATRPIKSGEEITTPYCVPWDVRSSRQQDLQKYMFNCDCPACGPDFEMFDQTRLDIAASAEDLIADFITWVDDKTLPEDKLITTSRWWIKVIESERLESSDFYRQHLVAIYRAYIALGDKENAAKYGILLGKWYQAIGQLEPPIELYSDPRNFQRQRNWAVRKV